MATAMEHGIEVLNFFSRFDSGIEDVGDIGDFTRQQ